MAIGALVGAVVGKIVGFFGNKRNRDDVAAYPPVVLLILGLLTPGVFGMVFTGLGAISGVGYLSLKAGGATALATQGGGFFPAKTAGNGKISPLYDR